MHKFWWSIFETQWEPLFEPYLMHETVRKLQKNNTSDSAFNLQ